jgi:hypothetical protein
MPVRRTNQSGCGPFGATGSPATRLQCSCLADQPRVFWGVGLLHRLSHLHSSAQTTYRSATELIAAGESGQGPLAGLDGLASARALRDGGFSVAAVKADERISSWEVQLAEAARGTHTSHPGQPSVRQQRRQQQQQGQGEGQGQGQLQRVLTHHRRSRSGAVLKPLASLGASVGGEGDGSQGSAGPGSSSGVLLGGEALAFFRTGCSGVMEMKAERDIPPLFIGTSKVGLSPQVAGASAATLVALAHALACAPATWHSSCMRAPGPWLVRLVGYSGEGVSFSKTQYRPAQLAVQDKQRAAAHAHEPDTAGPQPPLASPTRGRSMCRISSSPRSRSMVPRSASALRSSSQVS